jgi:phosphomannomutase
VIILGRDSRVSGPWIENIVQGVLVGQGFQVISLGIVPTPTVQVIVQQKKALGGVIVTSSHNPVQWNGLKFVDSDGLFLAPELCEKMFNFARNPSQVRFPASRCVPET